MKVKLLMVAEVELHREGPTSEAVLEALVNEKLDHFRESVQPSLDHGITLYPANCDDLEELVTLDTRGDRDDGDTPIVGAKRVVLDEGENG